MCFLLVVNGLKQTAAAAARLKYPHTTGFDTSAWNHHTHTYGDDGETPCAGGFRGVPRVRAGCVRWERVQVIELSLFDPSTALKGVHGFK